MQIPIVRSVNNPCVGGYTASVLTKAVCVCCVTDELAAPVIDERPHAELSLLSLI